MNMEDRDFVNDQIESRQHLWQQIVAAPNMNDNAENSEMRSIISALYNPYTDLSLLLKWTKLENTLLLLNGFLNGTPDNFFLSRLGNKGPYMITRMCEQLCTFAVNNATRYNYLQLLSIVNCLKKAHSVSMLQYRFEKRNRIASSFISKHLVDKIKLVIESFWQSQSDLIRETNTEIIFYWLNLLKIVRKTTKKCEELFLYYLTYFSPLCWGKYTILAQLTPHCSKEFFSDHFPTLSDHIQLAMSKINVAASASHLYLSIVYSIKFYLNDQGGNNPWLQLLAQLLSSDDPETASRTTAFMLRSLSYCEIETQIDFVRLLHNKLLACKPQVNDISVIDEVDLHEISGNPDPFKETSLSKRSRLRRAYIASLSELLRFKKFDKDYIRNDHFEEITEALESENIQEKILAFNVFANLFKTDIWDDDLAENVWNFYYSNFPRYNITEIFTVESTILTGLSTLFDVNEKFSAFVKCIVKKLMEQLYPGASHKRMHVAVHFLSNVMNFSSKLNADMKQFQIALYNDEQRPHTLNAFVNVILHTHDNNCLISDLWFCIEYFSELTSELCSQLNILCSLAGKWLPTLNDFENDKSLAAPCLDERAAFDHTIFSYVKHYYISPSKPLLRVLEKELLSYLLSPLSLLPPDILAVFKDVEQAIELISERDLSKKVPKIVNHLKIFLLKVINAICPARPHPSLLNLEGAYAADTEDAKLLISPRERFYLLIVKRGCRLLNCLSTKRPVNRLNISRLAGSFYFRVAKFTVCPPVLKIIEEYFEEFCRNYESNGGIPFRIFSSQIMQMICDESSVQCHRRGGPYPAFIMAVVENAPAAHFADVINHLIEIPSTLIYNDFESNNVNVPMLRAVHCLKGLLIKHAGSSDLYPFLQQILCVCIGLFSAHVFWMQEAGSLLLSGLINNMFGLLHEPNKLDLQQFNTYFSSVWQHIIRTLYSPVPNSNDLRLIPLLFILRKINVVDTVLDKKLKEQVKFIKIILASHLVTFPNWKVKKMIAEVLANMTPARIRAKSAKRIMRKMQTAQIMCSHRDALVKLLWHLAPNMLSTYPSFANSALPNLKPQANTEATLQPCDDSRAVLCNESLSDDEPPEYAHFIKIASSKTKITDAFSRSVSNETGVSANTDFDTKSEYLLHEKMSVCMTDDSSTNSVVDNNAVHGDLEDICDKNCDEAKSSLPVYYSDCGPFTDRPFLYVTKRFKLKRMSVTDRWKTLIDWNQMPEKFQQRSGLTDAELKAYLFECSIGKYGVTAGALALPLLSRVMKFSSFDARDGWLTWSNLVLQYANDFQRSSRRLAAAHSLIISAFPLLNKLATVENGLELHCIILMLLEDNDERVRRVLSLAIKSLPIRRIIYKYRPSADIYGDYLADHVQHPVLVRRLVDSFLIWPTEAVCDGNVDIPFTTRFDTYRERYAVLKRCYQMIERMHHNQPDVVQLAVRRKPCEQWNLYCVVLKEVFHWWYKKYEKNEETLNDRLLLVIAKFSFCAKIMNMCGHVIRLFLHQVVRHAVCDNLIDTADIVQRKITQNMLAELKLVTGRPSHPQSQGADERLNGVVQDKLVIGGCEKMNAKDSQWD
ncbi:hypothetical protein T4B_14882 [Trichinella pseudospiralis]|uniref:DUF2428 domain-containing protein n=1 Tax=Trichinella pseudospiralis TaxID=6337 RepID=A0A0V1EJS6_TRIPS|nr:hypothetical protein T4A_13522 [Trichinella pseudospiralis]KRZ33844.1 hypothetical protein T4B_14882 [Trichinella pseudospiralis]KRZ37593.1 hypothetical protein T4C_12216 [Trichinella pseudospiralis]